MRNFDAELSSEIQTVLMSFRGEQSCKALFAEVLSYDLYQDELDLTTLVAHVRPHLEEVKVFAKSSSKTVVYVALKSALNGPQIEQLAGAIRREVHESLMLLHDRPDGDDPGGWCLYVTDERQRPHLRSLALPGPRHELAATARALASIAGEDSEGEVRDDVAVLRGLEREFPGISSRLDQVVNDYEEISQHWNPEVRDLLPLYRSTGGLPLLTAAQERGDDLTGGEIVPDGSSNDFRRWRLVQHNMRLVLWMARAKPWPGMVLEDIVQEGCFGLIKASERWDPERGYRFSTYATWWIRQRMTRGWHDQCNIIRWPVHRAVEVLKKLRDNDEAGLRDSEKRVKIPRFDITRVTLHADADTMLTVERDDLCRGIACSLGKLDDRQRLIMERRWGFGGRQEETLDSIGQTLKLTRERVRQIEAKAVKRLRGDLSFELIAYREALTNRLYGNQHLCFPAHMKTFREYVRGQRRAYSSTMPQPEASPPVVVTAVDVERAIKNGSVNR